MTEFEKQVAETLKKPIHDDGWCVNNFNVGHEACSGRCDHISKLLAPRVAAAMDADRFEMADDRARSRGAALRALRGE